MLAARAPVAAAPVAADAAPLEVWHADVLLSLHARMVIASFCILDSSKQQDLVMLIDVGYPQCT